MNIGGMSAIDRRIKAKIMSAVSGSLHIPFMFLFKSLHLQQTRKLQTEISCCSNLSFSLKQYATVRTPPSTVQKTMLGLNPTMTPIIP